MILQNAFLTSDSKYVVFGCVKNDVYKTVAR